MDAGEGRPLEGMCNDVVSLVICGHSVEIVVFNELVEDIRAQHHKRRHGDEELGVTTFIKAAQNVLLNHEQPGGLAPDLAVTDARDLALAGREDPVESGDDLRIELTHATLSLKRVLTVPT